MVSVWVPIVTLLVGFAVSALLELWRDKRLEERERSTREFQRAEAKNERRDEFQRDTLRNLQQALYEYMRAIGRLNYEDVVLYRMSGGEKAFGTQPLSEEWNQKLLDATRSARIYQVRVLDDETRALVDEIVETGGTCMAANSENVAAAAMTMAGKTFERANDRIGSLLRTLY